MDGFRLMFRAGMKEKFDRWNKKYAPDDVFKVWVEMVGGDKFRFHFRKVGWKVDMTIKEALVSTLLRSQKRPLDIMFSNHPLFNN